MDFFRKKNETEESEDKQEVIDNATALLCTNDFEGYQAHAYIDTAGLMTIGCGKQIENEQDFINALLRDSSTRELLSLKKKKELFSDLKTEEEKEKKNFFEKHTHALFYNRTPENQSKDPSLSLFRTIFVSEDDAVKMTKEHLKEIYPKVQEEHNKYGIRFEEQPPAYRVAALEMKYNMGNHYRLATEAEKERSPESEKRYFWPKFTDAVKKGDFFEASRNSSRLGASKARNEKVKLILENAQIQKYHKEKYGTWK